MRSLAGPAAALVALTVALGAPPASARTLSDQLDVHLEALATAKGGWAHWHLAEAQRLAPDVIDGRARLRPVALALTETGREPWIQGEALGTLASLDHASDPAASRAHLRAGGVLIDGVVLGPLRGPGVDADPTPALHWEPTFTTDGARGAVGWRPFTDAGLAGPLQLDDLLDGAADAHAWIVVALEVAQPTDAMITVGSSGPVAAWLGDQPILEFTGERALTDWQHAVPVSLAAGTHRLAVRAGHRSAAPELLVRVLDARGRLPDGVTLRAPRADDAPGRWSPPRKGALPATPPSLGKKDPALAGRLALLFDHAPLDRRAAAMALEAAVADAPEDARLWALLARAERADPDRRRRAYEEARRLDPEDPQPLAALLQAHRLAGLEASADGLSRALGALDPDHPTWVGDRLRRAHQLSDPVTALGVLPQEVLERWRAHPRVGPSIAGLQADAGLPKLALPGWTQLVRARSGDAYAVRKAVELARAAGDPASGLAAIDLAATRRPHATSLALLRARVLAGDPDTLPDAIAALDAALASRGDNADLHEFRGRLLLLGGERAAALAAFDTALDLRPQDRDLAEYRRSLVAEGTWFADAIEDPEAVIEAVGEREPAPEGARYLLDTHLVRVHDSGLSSRFRQQLVAIEDDRVTEHFTELAFPFTPGEDRLEVVEAEILHLDGTRTRPSAMFDHRPRGKQAGVYTLGALRIVRFEALEEGDVIHIQTRRDEIGRRNIFGAFFGVLLPVQEPFPKDRVSVTFDVPSSRALYHHAAGLPAPTRVEGDGRARLTFARDDLPAVALEPRMPGWGEVAAYVSVSTYQTWSDLARWYAELVRPQLELTDALAATAREITAAATDTRSKVAAVQAWVVRNTRYVGIEFGIHGFKPYRVAQVVQRGYGDCKDKASLLITMLGAVGVDAHFVLVRTRDLGLMGEDPPTLWAFNHAIAYVPELDLYIDGTSEYAGLGELPQLDQGATVLRIDVLGDATQPVFTRIPISPATDNLVTSRGRITVAPSGDATAAITETVHGTGAPELRMLFEEESRREEILANLLGRIHPGAALEGHAFEGLRALDEPVAVTFETRLPSYATPSRDGLEVPLLLDPDAVLRDLGRAATRRQPMVLDYPSVDDSRYEVLLPPNASTRTPEPVRLDTRFGSFELSVTSDGPSKLVVASRLTLTVARVEPADYPDFRAFLVKVAAARRGVVHVGLDGAGG